MYKYLVVLILIGILSPAYSSAGLVNNLNNFIIDSPIVDHSLQNAGIDPSSSEAKLARDIAKDTLGTGDYNNAQNRVDSYLRTKRGQRNGKKSPRAENQLSKGDLNFIGHRYYRGKGVPQDTDKAKRYWEMAAKKGNIIALYNLSVLYFEGKGNVNSDIRKSRSYAKQAKEKGSAAAIDLYNMLNNIDDHYKNWRYHTTNSGHTIRVVADRNFEFYTPLHGSVSFLSVIPEDGYGEGITYALQSEAGFYQLPQIYSPSFQDRIEKVLFEDLNDDGIKDIIIFATSRYKYNGNTWSDRLQANMVFLSSEDGHYYTNQKINDCDSCRSARDYKGHIYKKAADEDKSNNGNFGISSVSILPLSGKRDVNLNWLSGAPSFNCKRASTAIEKEICENEEVALADSAMSFIYKKSRKSLSKEGRKKLKLEQRAWIKERDSQYRANCIKPGPLSNPPMCLKKVIQQRTSEIYAYFFTNKTH